LEDEYLIDSWKEVSLCPITGANQNSSKYYKRHRKNFGGYSTINMLHNDSAMSHGWDIIKKGLQQIPWKLYEGEEPVGERAMADVVSHYLSMPMSLYSPLCSCYEFLNW
jgi:hypothetical protein